MLKAHIVVYVAIAALTPVLVLVSSILNTAAMSASSAQPWQSMLHMKTLMTVASNSWASSYREVANASSVGQPFQARITTDEGQPFLELFTPFNTMAQTPDLMVVLDKTAMPSTDLSTGDRHFVVGQLQSTAGHQRYRIPEDVDIRQYLSVMIWCPELDSIIGYIPLSAATSTITS
ncbi:MAG: DM13 domain-containing protein [Cyanobacteria bacterium P01_H01_bin.58]